jgi:micrococcal nuclease
MGRLAAFRGISILLVAIAMVTTACDSRPTSDVFNPSTTSTTVLGGGTLATTPPQTLPPPEERVTASVISITDGDTLEVRIDGATSDLRMLGINAPELDECWGPESTIELAQLIEGQDVLLVSGEEDADEFGRLLRYVYLDEPDGAVFINSTMVESGNAIGLSNGHDYERSFKSLEASAFQSGAGMWGTFVCGDDEGIVADRPVIRVSDVQYNPDGPDNETLEEETVTIVNEGYGRVSMAGWVLRDESSRHRMTFPEGTLLVPGDSVTVVTGCSGGPEGAIHWCNDGAVWSNQGDTVIVSDTQGNAVIRYWYEGSEGS